MMPCHRSIQYFTPAGPTSEDAGQQIVMFLQQYLANFPMAIRATSCLLPQHTAERFAYLAQIMQGNQKNQGITLLRREPEMLDQPFCNSSNVKHVIDSRMFLITDS